MFTDTVSFTLQAGKGGDGIVSWRREKYLPKGGPCGGDGGKGGNIIFQVNSNLLSLEDYRNKKIISAKNGRPGGTNNQKGKNGKDLILQVPPGTSIKYEEETIDLTEENQKLVICRGGKGGWGNTHFKTSVNQAPNTCTLGTEGEAKNVVLDLKLIADVGLVGFPNAGKSTLMSNITNAKVKIAPYPFTTLSPNLGYLLFEDYSKALIADIPGIIEQAHLNKGLGISFLKHIERTSVLVYVIDASGLDGRDPIHDFKTLRTELKNYNKDMLKKPFMVVLNKTDLEISQEYVQSFKENFSLDIFEISALKKTGLKSFLNALKKKL